VFVASRFPAMVSSLAMEIPTVVIGWSHKYEEVLQMFGLERFAVGHADLTPERFEQLLAQVCQERDALTEQIRASLVEVKARAMEQIALIEGIAIEHADARADARG
jgi:polysaccharide pyruvyl transferase WcaK-like protein